MNLYRIRLVWGRVSSSQVCLHTYSFWSHQSGFYDQRQKQSFFAANILWIWWKNKQGYTQKNQILSVKYGAGSVMILDSINSQKILNDCFCHEAKTGLLMDLLAGIWSKTLHPNPNKMVQWPPNETFDMNTENMWGALKMRVHKREPWRIWSWIPCSVEVAWGQPSAKLNTYPVQFSDKGVT